MKRKFRLLNFNPKSIPEGALKEQILERRSNGTVKGLRHRFLFGGKTFEVDVVKDEQEKDRAVFSLELEPSEDVNAITPPEWSGDFFEVTRDPSYNIPAVV